MSFLSRKLRVWARFVRFSRLVAGPKYQDLIKDRLVESFRVVNRFLGELEIEYCLIYGTLLGHYREGDIIKGDNDIDLGTFEPNYSRIVSQADRLPPGYTLHDTTHRHNGPKLYVASPDGWEVDIYFFRDLGEQLQSTTIESNSVHMLPFAKDLMLPLQATEFVGQKTWVPHQSEAWLRHSYGYLGPDAYLDKQTSLWKKLGQ